MTIVQLKLGDLFTGPSDLIVLPCSTAGTITDLVRQRLINYRIPYPRPGMKLGDVAIIPFQGGENIAQYVAFAASVESQTSSEEAIRRIGEQLGSETKQHSTIRLVAAPLLGTGAGNLSSRVVVGALSTGFKLTAHNDASLLIYILNPDEFKKISENIKLTKFEQTQELAETIPPRVFISYCHTSPEHEEWVESLGSFLRESGIEARLDIWHLRRGMDLPQFMTNELALADRVILVSDEKYAEKADGRVGGVGWETMIIQGDMYTLPPESTKYLVIVRSKNLDDGLPKYLKTKFVIPWSNEITDKRNRQLLLRELYDQIIIPPRGQIPVFL